MTEMNSLNYLSASSLKIDREEESTSRSFLSAYVSLILIILTFILAFFFKADTFIKDPNILLRIPSTPISGAIEIERPFEDDTHQINLEAWSGVVFTLKNHDLDGEILVEAASDGEALALSERIRLGLVGEGIPGGALRVYGSIGPIKGGSGEDSPVGDEPILSQSNRVLVKFYDSQR